MTIICSFQNDDALLMVGDLLLSGNQESRKSIQIPTRFHPQQATINPQFSGLTQKLLLIDDHLAVGWAGSKIVATHLIKQIQNNLFPPYSGPKILKCIYGSGLAKEELEKVSFIFFGYTQNPKEKLFVQDYLAGQTILPDGSKVKYSGSGSFHFLDSIEFQMRLSSGTPNSYAEAVSAFIGRCAIALYSEIVSDITHNFFYGGGFEVLLFSGEKSKYIKIPLIFIFWACEDQGLEFVGPILEQFYDDFGVLCIRRLNRTDTGKFAYSEHQVTNLLHKNFRPCSMPNAAPAPADVAVHYLISRRNPQQVKMLLKKGDPPIISSSNDDCSKIVEVKWSRSLLYELLDAVAE